MRLLLLALLAAAVPAAAQDLGPPVACPCTSYGPYPRAAIAVMALPDQADILGLTEAQVVALTALRAGHLRAIHEVQGDIEALRETLHGLDRPYRMDETFAVLYDLGRHEAELAAAFETSAAVLLDALTDAQRERWDALLAEAAALQETAPGCNGDL